jgi:membrane protein DedA with SNARE-associated domain
MTALPASLRRPERPPPEPWKRNLVFGIIGTTIVLGWIGDALWASLVDRSPLTLIALNAKPRYLVLTVNQLDPWVYYPFATFRLLFTKPLVWLVGAWYGQRAILWAERRSERGGRMIRFLERHFGRWGWLIVSITASNPVCLLAGSTGFPLGWFMVLAIAGTLVRLWAVDVFGAAFTDTIDAVIEFVVANRPWVVAASVALVVGGLIWERRSGRSTDLDDLLALEHAMEREDGAEGEAGETAAER